MTKLHPPLHKRQAPADGGAVPTPIPRAAPVRLLTFSTLYPNPAQPHHGVFVENRLQHLVQSGDATATVLAPVPWLPLQEGRSPRYPDVAESEVRHGLTVLHPRYLALPALGMWSNPWTLFRTAQRALVGLIAQGQRFDVIDAHYLYPDGVAAIWLGREFGLPVVITARGSDTSLLPRYRLPRWMIRTAITRADGLVAVSSGLKEGLVALGAPAAKVVVLRNGVDLKLFQPPRCPLGALPSGYRHLLSVGLLIPRKGHDLIIRALPLLPGHALTIVGEGPERAALLALARGLGVADRLHLAGAVPHNQLPGIYAAADALVLASSREGWANVLLEAMASGTPVIASPAWGSREAVNTPAAGLVLEETTPQTIAAAVIRLLASPPDRAATRAHAERFGWEETTQGQLRLFRQLVVQP